MRKYDNIIFVIAKALQIKTDIFKMILEKKKKTFQNLIDNETNR